MTTSRDNDGLPDLKFLVARPAWNDEALCKGKTHLFFATPGERDGRRKRREALARAYCACCSVADNCRAAGREGREHGLWGGENEEERARAGFAATSPHRRVVAAAAREARRTASGPEVIEVGMALPGGVLIEPSMAAAFG